MLIGPPGFCRQIFRNESLAQVGYLSHRDGCQAGARRTGAGGTQYRSDHGEQREVRRSIIALAPLSNLNSNKRAIRA